MPVLTASIALGLSEESSDMSDEVLKNGATMTCVSFTGSAIMRRAEAGDIARLSERSDTLLVEKAAGARNASQAPAAMAAKSTRRLQVTLWRQERPDTEVSKSVCSLCNLQVHACHRSVDNFKREKENGMDDSTFFSFSQSRLSTTKLVPCSRVRQVMSILILIFNN